MAEKEGVNRQGASSEELLEQILDHLQTHQLSQFEMAEYLGVHRSTLTNWLTRRTTIRGVLQCKIRRLLGTPQKRRL